MLKNTELYEKLIFRGLFLNFLYSYDNKDHI